MWFKTLQFYTQCLGGWRKRRKALGNIMIDPNVVTATENLKIHSEGAEAEALGATDNCPTEGACALPSSDS